MPGKGEREREREPERVRWLLERVVQVGSKSEESGDDAASEFCEKKGRRGKKGG